MQIAELLRARVAEGRPVFSAEFFPPKNPEGEALLWETVARLQPYRPDFVSVTYGAGGSTQETSIEITRRLIAEAGLPTLAHLTCVGASAAELVQTVSAFAAAGVTDILALRGDPATGPGTPWVETPGGYRYAVELVRAIKQTKGLGIAVAAFPEGHPEAPSLDADAEVLAAKQAAGADFAITNLFFTADKYFALRDRAERLGCTFPILPGLMPVTSLTQIARFAALSGAAFPTDLAARFERVADDPAAVRELGVEVTTRLGAELLAGGAPGIHLYTLNRSTSSEQVLSNLGVQPRG